MTEQRCRQVRAQGRRTLRVLVVLLVWLTLSVPAAAQTVSLTLSRTTLPFVNADPDTTPSIAAPVLTVTYRVRGNSFGSWLISVVASGNFSNGPATIPVSRVTWTATPSPPFQAGTMSATVAQRLAGGSGNIDPSRTAQVTFFLVNDWAYDVGTYSTMFTFTLTAP